MSIYLMNIRRRCYRPLIETQLLLVSQTHASICWKFTNSLNLILSASSLSRMFQLESAWPVDASSKAKWKNILPCGDKPLSPLIKRYANIHDKISTFDLILIYGSLLNSQLIYSNEEMFFFYKKSKKRIPLCQIISQSYPA